MSLLSHSWDCTQTLRAAKGHTIPPIGTCACLSRIYQGRNPYHLVPKGTETLTVRLIVISCYKLGCRRSCQLVAATLTFEPRCMYKILALADAHYHGSGS